MPFVVSVKSTFPAWSVEACTEAWHNKAVPSLPLCPGSPANLGELSCVSVRPQLSQKLLSGRRQTTRSRVSTVIFVRFVIRMTRNQKSIAFNVEQFYAVAMQKVL
jgi:hypothetical protein